MKSICGLLVLFTQYEHTLCKDALVSFRVLYVSY